MTTSVRRRELQMQNRIIESYKNYGGYAKKWATDVQVGVPDLIATTLLIGGHLVEVKHRPEWKENTKYKNPMTLKQQLECKRYIQGGMPVFLAIVIGPDLRHSKLYYVNTQNKTISLWIYPFVEWRTGEGFDINKLVIASMPSGTANRGAESTMLGSTANRGAES